MLTHTHTHTHTHALGNPTHSGDKENVDFFPELGGFHHDSPNSRLQHDIEKKQDPMIRKHKTHRCLFAYCPGYLNKKTWRIDLLLEES